MIRRLIHWLTRPPMCIICRKRPATLPHPDGGAGGVCGECAARDAPPTTR